MQDKPVHITKKMTDKGWSEMNRLLDAEMPAPASRRRRLGWWFLLLGLIIGLVSGVLIVRYLNRPDVPLVDTNTPIAAVPQVNKDLEQNHEILPAGASVADPAIAGNNLQEVEVQLPSKSAGKSKQILFNHDMAEKSVSSLSMISDKSLETVQTLPGNVNSPDTENKLSSAHPPAVNRATDAASLAILSVRQLDIPEKVIAVDRKTFPETGSNSLIIYGSGLTAPGNLATGVAGGLLKNTTLKNSRFSVEGGVGYAYIQQPISVIFSSQPGSVSVNSTFTEFKTLLGDAEIARSAASAGNAAKLLKKLQLHYLEIPVALKYRLTPRLNLTSGLNAGILLNSSSDYTTGGIFSAPVNPNNLVQDEAEASFDYSGEEPTVRLNYFDLAANAGVDFRISKRLETSLGYQFGMLDLIPDNGAGDFNRAVRVTLRYSLAGTK